MTRPAVRWALVAILILALFGLATFAWHRHESADALRRFPAPGRLITIAPGQRLHLYCLGQGAPAVLFEAGMSGWSADWGRVQRVIAADTRACAYDRAGYGWSDRAPGPRDARATVGRLRALLRAGSVEPPFILVGHSLGGLYAQAFAARYPRDVAGLVLVDAVHRRQSAAMHAAMRQSYEANLLRLTGWSSKLAPTGLLRLARQPASIVAHRLEPADRAAAIALSYRSSSYRALAGEMAAFRATQAQIGELPPSLPLSVLAAEELRDYPPGFGAPEKRLWNDLQNRHAPRGNRVVPVAGSGHYIQLDNPGAVIAAIRSQVAARRPEPRAN